jgi:hypothetical protein
LPTRAAPAPTQHTRLSFSTLNIPPPTAEVTELLNPARHGARCQSRPRHYSQVGILAATTTSRPLTNSSALKQSFVALKESKRLGRRAAELHNQAEKYIESYAMSSCQVICEDMQKKLPRELRDNIYKCIVGEETAHNASTKHPPWLEDTYHSHLCDAKYIGSITKTELAETWYRLVLFKIPSGVDIERFLNRDM